MRGCVVYLELNDMDFSNNVTICLEISPHFRYSESLAYVNMQGRRKASQLLPWVDRGERTDDTRNPCLSVTRTGKWCAV